MFSACDDAFAAATANIAKAIHCLQAALATLSKRPTPPALAKLVRLVAMAGVLFRGFIHFLFNGLVFIFFVYISSNNLYVGIYLIVSDSLSFCLSFFLSFFLFLFLYFFSFLIL